MAENTSRFVIIDGVQIEKARARRMGLIDENDNIVKRKSKVTPKAAAEESPADAPDDSDADDDDSDSDADAPSVDEPTNRRARGADSARRG